MGRWQRKLASVCLNLSRFDSLPERLRLKTAYRGEPPTALIAIAKRFSQGYRGAIEEQAPIAVVDGIETHRLGTTAARVARVPWMQFSLAT